MKGFVKTVQEVWSQLPIGREHFHMKVTNKHQFWVSDQGVVVHKLTAKKCVSTNHKGWGNQSLDVCQYLHQSSVSKSVHFCQVFGAVLILRVSGWGTRVTDESPLFVDFSNPPLGSKCCPGMSIFFVYKDQNIYKNYCIILSYHL